MPPSRTYSDPDVDRPDLGPRHCGRDRLVEGRRSAAQHRSPFHGFNVEFASYREYGPGRRFATISTGVSSPGPSGTTSSNTNRRVQRPRQLGRRRQSASMNYRGSGGRAVEIRLRGHDGRRPGDAPGAPAGSGRPGSLRRIGRTTVLPSQRDVVAGHDVLSGLARKACTPARQDGPGGAAQNRYGAELRRRGAWSSSSPTCSPTSMPVYDGLNRLRFLGHEVLVMQVLDRDEIESPLRRTRRFSGTSRGTKSCTLNRAAIPPSRISRAMQRFPRRSSAKECGKRWGMITSASSLTSTLGVVA